MSIQCSRGSRSFAKETRALKMRSVVGDHWKLTTTNWEQSLKLSLLQPHEKPPMNSALTILLSLGIWGKWERWKSSISECLLRWLEKKNQTIVLKCCLLVFYTTTMNHFSIRLWHVTKSGFGMTAGDNQLSGWPEKKLQSTSQSQTCTKKWSWSLVVCCQADPLQFSESQRNRYIWEVCSANGWYALKIPTSVASTGQQKGPILLHDNAQTHIAQHFKNWTNWAMKFCLIHHIPLTYWLPLLQESLNNFLQGKHFHNQLEAENAFQEFLESWSTNCYATGINKLNFHW